MREIILMEGLHTEMPKISVWELQEEEYDDHFFFPAGVKGTR